MKIKYRFQTLIFHSFTHSLYISKVQRRINAVETRADAYRRQVTKLSSQLEKQLVASADRIDKVEARLNSRSEDDNVAQLSKRLAVLERGMNQIYAKVAFPSGRTERGTGRLATEDEAGGSANSNRMFPDSVEEGGDVHGHLPRLRDPAVDSVVRSMVQAEVRKLTEDFKEYMKEYDQVFSLFLNPDKRTGVDIETGFAFNDKGTGHGDFTTRNKLIPDERAEGGPQSTQQASNQELHRDKGGEGVGGTLKSDAKEVKSAEGVKVPEEPAQNDTQKYESLSSAVLSEDFVAVNDSEMYLTSEDLSETNDTFSGENPDLNATGVLATEDADDYNIGSSRIGQGEEKVESADTGTKNNIHHETLGELRKKNQGDSAMPGWMRDGADRQSEMEERFKSEIRAMLFQPLANIVSLVEKQAVTLRDEIQRQGKRTQESLRAVSSRVDKLDSRAEAVELRVESLSRGFQDSQDRLDRVKELEVAVHELKKNLTSSWMFLGDAAAAGEPKMDASALDKQGKRVKKLERLLGVFNSTLEHYHNETMHKFRELRLDLEAKLDADIKQSSIQLKNQRESSTTQALSRLNRTLQHQVEDINFRLQTNEESVVSQQTKIRVVENDGKRQANRCKRDIKDIRKINIELSEQLDDLDKSQTSLADFISGVETKISDMEIDMRLSVSDEWVPLQFHYDASRTGCFGEQYVRRLKYKQARFVGVMVCSAERYKIFLATSRYETFLNIGDRDGYGEDHCEFVGASRDARVSVNNTRPGYITLEGEA